MADKDKTTLREFIKQLEKLSDGGKNDDLEVGLLTNDEEFHHLGWFGIDTSCDNFELRNYERN